MRRRFSEITLILLGILIGGLTNIATGELPTMLPPTWRSYLWLAWVPLGLSIVAVLVLEWQARGQIPSSSTEDTNLYQFDVREQEAHVEKLQRHLSVLEQKIAHYGEAAAPVHLIIEREDIERKLATVHEQLQNRRERKRIIEKVRDIWISDYLEQELKDVSPIELSLANRPDAVTTPLADLDQKFIRPTSLLPSGMSPSELFAHIGEEFLILGAAGAGKTMLLLKLCRELLGYAEQNNLKPIPVVFMLSTWSKTGLPLEQWMATELSRLYEIDRSMAQKLVADNTILPLLDGLDEVPVDRRDSLVETINRFKQEGRGVPLVVSSRIEDYERLDGKLQLRRAIVIQPLTLPMIAAYLDRLIEDYPDRLGLPQLRRLLESEPRILELINTPLMLGLAIRQFEKTPTLEIEESLGPERWRYYLFDSYVHSMLHRRKREDRYSNEQTVASLAWLAHQMQQQEKTAFTLSTLQLPDDRGTVPSDLGVNMLPAGGQFVMKLILTLEVALVTGVAGGVISAVLGAPVALGLLLGIGVGGMSAATMAFFYRYLFENSTNIIMLRDAEILVIIGLIVWASRGGAGTMLLAMLGGYLIYGVALLLEAPITLMFLLVIGWMLSWWPQGRGLRFTGGVGVALVIVIILRVVLYYWAGWWMTWWLEPESRNLIAWAIAVLLLVLAWQHHFEVFALRIVAALWKLLPYPPDQFLNYCVERGFLRQIGVYYVFVHSTLQEHFASRAADGNTVYLDGFSLVQPSRSGLE